MTVKIGHARHDEHGNLKHGKAGDQTGGEVTISNYYVHTKKWVLLRCIDPEKRNKIAEAMEKACKNNDIGYDQSQRYTLFENVKNKGFDPSKTTKRVETDCSELTRVCISYAYGKDITGKMRTNILPKVLVKTGEFKKHTSAKYCKSSNYLRRGDILCTSTMGHVVVVLNDGALVDGKLTVDGVWKKETTKKTQKVLDVKIDGFIYNQATKYKKYLPAVSESSWRFKNANYANGSTTIKAIQKLVGKKESGICGNYTVKYMQKFLKAKCFYKGFITGRMDKATVKAWQRYINSKL